MGRISGRYAVGRGILFGSRARRTHNATSDADIAVVLKGEHGKRSTTASDMAGIAVDAMQETGNLVEALRLGGDEMENPEQFSNPAQTRTIKREGVAREARPSDRQQTGKEVVRGKRGLRGKA